MRGGQREKEEPETGMLFARGVCHHGTLHYTIKGARNRSGGQPEFYVPHLPRGSLGVRKVIYSWLAIASRLTIDDFDQIRASQSCIRVNCDKRLNCGTKLR